MSGQNLVQSAEADEIVWSARLGARLEASRLHAGMRRVDLAAKLGLSEETIRLWEKGAVQPSAERLARLIAVLSLGTAEWMTEAPERPAELPVLAQRLRDERAARGLTQAAAVLLLDVPQATYAGWETGRTTPGAQHFEALADFLGLAATEVAELCESPFVVDYADWPPFGQLVGARREALRLSRADLAEALGVSQGTVVAWELGYRVPAAKHLSNMSEVLMVDAAALAEALPRRRSLTGLGELIVSRQQELGLQSADLARLVGTTEPTMSRWINGHSKPVPKNLRRLADALSVPYRTLIEAAGAPT